MQRSYFASQMVNILDCVSFSTEKNRGMHNLSYKKLVNNSIQDISIRITDQLGRSVPFIGIVT